MATRSEEFFHEKWLGMVQTESDGLVVAKPVLLEAGCANRQPPETQEKLRELCPAGAEEAPRRIDNLMEFFQQLLDFDANLFEPASAIPDEVSLYAPEGPQTIRPTFGLLRQDEPEPQIGAGSPASDAAAKYVALLWDVSEIEDETKTDAIGLPLDKPETITGGWSYPAAAKFDRLLRHCRVPVGILTNREVIRLVYAPHGESSGHITFRVDDMATVGGRPILDAMIMLLCANQWFGVSDENALPSLLRRSREYQGTVTEDLAEQVFSGLETLLKGFQTAAERDKSGLLREALERDEDHLYRGLLTVMLRLVFILYAEDRGLLPVDHPLYAKRMSLLGLFERLQRDHGNFPDSMNNRFGSWGHIISLFRAIFLGVEHGDFRIPPRQGDLFDPHTYPFLEGWYGPSAPIVTQMARAEVKVPTVDDGTVFALLQSLLVFQGQRLSYRTLDVEQIGSVYEALMGYQVSPCKSPAVAIKIKNKKGAAKYWVEPEAVLARPAGQRVKWLKDECGVDTPVAKKIKKVLDGVGNPDAAIEALLPLAAGKKGLAHEQQASIGQYILQPGSERRSSGTNYTPRSMTEPIVRKTLEPLIRCLGDEPTAGQLFELKICDPAMGSGAFLVECCRQLADEVVAAWGRAHDVEAIAADCPEGDVVAHARRLVAQRCLYGVDKNPMAVPLAKLSLWLFTLARELPFTFLDHSLRHGDSLLGLDFEQIKAFHWKPEKQLSFIEIEIARALGEVVAIRQEIHQLAANSSPEGQKLKAQRLFDANDATEKIRRVADVCVGAFFAEAKDKTRLVERQLREDRIRTWLEGDNEAVGPIEAWVETIRSQHAPFHWWLEFPEVFYAERPDPLATGTKPDIALMDGFVGNPPFMNGNKVSGSFGTSYRSFLLESYEGTTGKADLCSVFFLRCSELLGESGALGFIATNSISEGDTREAGLRVLVRGGARIYDAVPNVAWPGDAAVTVSMVHVACGRVMPGNVHLNGKAQSIINSRLQPRPEREDPVRLSSNRGKALQGVDVYGDGFWISNQEASELVSQSARNAERLLPFIGADEIASNWPIRSERYAIFLSDLSVKEASEWPELFAIVEERVRPGRTQLRDNADGRRLSKNWWRYNRDRPGLAIVRKAQSQYLVVPIHCKHLLIAEVDSRFLISHGVYGFSLESSTAFAILQSRIHESWAWRHSSTIRNAGIRYAASDCFDTFPFPRRDLDAVISKVEAAGDRLRGAREEFMTSTGKGLTATYNALKDPDCDQDRVLELRTLHEAMDRSVLDAYGWSQLEVPPYCPMSTEEETALDDFVNEVIDHLYVLNTERAAEDTKQRPNKRGAKKASSKKTTGTSLSLPGLGDAEGAS